MAHMNNKNRFPSYFTILSGVILTAFSAIFSAIPAFAAPVDLPAATIIDATIIDSAIPGDTAWVMTSAALVLMMSLPGVALFYGGLVRAKNFLSVMIQCGAIAALVSVIWIILGYTMAFGEVHNGIIGAGNAWMLLGLGNVRIDTGIAESAFVLFQMTFAIITPLLMVGAWVERARFGWVLAFAGLWSVIVYAPVAHWIWGGGWLAQMGVRDFAGGIVVHTTAGVSALVAALIIGRRTGWPRKIMLPHAPALTIVGASLLWVGWFGFNGGSALTANDDAASAIINTHVSASMAALVWLLIERIKIGKPTSIGFATGAIAGLAAITPAADVVSPGAAIIFGLLSAIVCYFSIGFVKNKIGIDDSLDVFAVHGMGGILGSILLAFFMSPALGGVGYYEGVTMIGQLLNQLMGISSVIIWSIIATLIIGYALSMVLPMRVGRDVEADGLDINEHGERAWEMD